MTIEIHQPELEALIEQRMSTGRYRSIEDFLLRSLDRAEEDESPANPKQSLMDMFAKARGLGEGVDFSRDRSAGREIDLS